MRHTIIAILVSFISLAANSQTTQIMGAPGVKVINRGDFQADSILYIPRTLVLSRSPSQVGALRYQSSDSSLYQWTGTAWRKAGGVSFTGTDNYLPKFTASGTNINNSEIYQTPGGKIAIGTITDTALSFNVKGASRFYDSIVVRATNPSAYFNIGGGAPFLSMGWADITQNHRFRSAGASNDGLQFELKDTTAKWQISPGGYFATFWGTNDATRIIISDTTTTKIEKGNFIVTNGTIKTKAPTDGTSQPWRLGDYVTTAPSATGYVQVEINGVKYKLLAATY